MNPKGNGLSGQVASRLISIFANHLEVEVNSMLMKCMSETRLEGAAGDDLVRGNAAKGFGEVRKTSGKFQLGNNLKY